MDEEWLTTTAAAALWDRIVGGGPKVFELPSHTRFQRMCRTGELAGFGIDVQKFAGRYAINRQSLLSYVQTACRETCQRIEAEMGDNDR
jgi:hypothetical protein